MTLEEALRQLTSFHERWQRDAPQLGLAFAEVTGVSDEGYTLSYYSGNVDASSAPARVATLMAGNGRGAYFMPEVGDEVVVGFEMGDLDRPVILGALWSDVDPPPSQADTSSANNVRTIVSRAGHEITFDDSPAGKILIRTRGGFEISIQDGISPKIEVKTTGDVASSRIVLDGVSWNHQHASGTGPSGPPVSIVPVV
jgi:uncharacterized protein involved in type VI secretion and phage assembly